MKRDSLIASPYNATDEYSYCQTIYLENEIQGSGIITGLTYYYRDTGLSNSNLLDIYIGITNLDDIDSAYIIKISTMKKVSDGALTNYTIPGPVTITLDTPFYYNGKGNLVIAINEKKDGYEANSYTSWFTGYGLKFGKHARSTCLSSLFTTWDIPLLESAQPYYYPPESGRGVAKVTFQGLIPLSCQSPKNVRFTNVGHVSAKVAWSPAGAGSPSSKYEVYYGTSRYKPASFTSPVITNVADTQVILSGLNPNTQYMPGYAAGAAWPIPACGLSLILLLLFAYHLQFLLYLKCLTATSHLLVGMYQ